MVWPTYLAALALAQIESAVAEYLAPAREVVQGTDLGEQTDQGRDAFDRFGQAWFGRARFEIQLLELGACLGPPLVVPLQFFPRERELLLRELAQRTIGVLVVDARACVRSRLTDRRMILECLRSRSKIRDGESRTMRCGCHP